MMKTKMTKLTIKVGESRHIEQTKKGQTAFFIIIIYISPRSRRKPDFLHVKRFQSGDPGVAFGA